MTLGVAIIDAVAGGSMGTDIGRGFAGARHAGWRIISGPGLLIAFVDALTTGRWTRGTAERAAGVVRSSASYAGVRG